MRFMAEGNLNLGLLSSSSALDRRTAPALLWSEDLWLYFSSPWGTACSCISERKDLDTFLSSGSYSRCKGTQGCHWALKTGEAAWIKGRIKLTATVSHIAEFPAPGSAPQPLASWKAVKSVLLWRPFELLVLQTTVYLKNSSIFFYLRYTSNFVFFIDLLFAAFESDLQLFH